MHTAALTPYSSCLPDHVASIRPSAPLPAWSMVRGHQEIALCAQMSVPQLELQLRHLLSLGHAKVTSAITMQSIYAVRTTHHHGHHHHQLLVEVRAPVPQVRDCCMVGGKRGSDRAKGGTREAGCVRERSDRADSWMMGGGSGRLLKWRPCMGVWLLQVKSTACTRLHSLESLGFQQLFSPANGHHETLFQVGREDGHLLPG